MSAVCQLRQSRAEGGEGVVGLDRLMGANHAPLLLQGVTSRGKGKGWVLVGSIAVYSFQPRVSAAF